MRGSLENEDLPSSYDKAYDMRRSLFTIVYSLSFFFFAFRLVILSSFYGYGAMAFFRFYFPLNDTKSVSRQSIDPVICFCF